MSTERRSDSGSVSARALTPRGQGGISVVRIAGAGAAELIDSLFENPSGRKISDLQPGRLVYGLLRKDGEILDEVLVCRHPDNPHLYELNCHGGVAPLRRVLETLKELGAKIETEAAGEESVWLSPGKAPVDRIRAEAAALLPEAATTLAARMLLDQLNGALTGAIESIIKDIRTGSFEPAAVKLRELLESSRLGLSLLDPERIVVVGKPNAGKSTLVNLLLREERVIVHEQPGATRDWIELLVSIRGYPFLLVDTAGISTDKEEIAAIASRRSRELIPTAGLVLLMVDRSSRWNGEDDALIGEIPPDRLIVVLNKSDLPAPSAPLVLDKMPECRVVSMSALTGDGVIELEDALIGLAFPRRWRRDMPVLFTERQLGLAAGALDALQSIPPDKSNEDSDRIIADTVAALTECVGDAGSAGETAEVSGDG